MPRSTTTRVVRLADRLERRASEASPCLVVLRGDTPGRLLPLDTATLDLGRAVPPPGVLDDEGVSRRHARVTRLPDGSLRLADLGSTNGTLIGGRPIDGRGTLLRDGDEIALGPTVLLRVTRLAPSELAAALAQEAAARQDPLTGLANRATFEAEALRRSASELDWALVLIDLDHFKAVNDVYGHPAGDAVLQQVSARMRATGAAGDLAGRLGGEEFGWLIGAPDPAAARSAAETLRRRIATVPVSVGLQRISVTASFGVLHRSERPWLSWPELLALADSRLYAAKHAGRNRVVATS
jgi:diguanylate cyclase (GGDEF)-like protein